MKEEDLAEPAVAAGVLVGQVISFGDALERLLEVMLVILVGAALATAWNVEAVLLALALFVVIPLATMLCLTGSPTSMRQRALMGWFGIRGIGSLYYLSYALSHGDAQQLAPTIPIALTVIAVSVLLHGISAQPMLKRYERSLG